MITSLPPYILFSLAVLLAAVISMYSVKKIIFITRHRKIYDIPDDTRKIHGPGIPSLGGIGIFIGYITIATLFWPEKLLYINFVLPSTLILFTTGIYDDLMNMRPSKKLLAQLTASFITIYFADIRISSLYGIFEVGELPYWLSILLTTMACTFFINVFNFVDGIDGLACITAILYTGIFGVLFALIQYHAIAWVAFSLAGAAAGLLWYNISPAKIYMGDTGSMMVGFTIFIFATLFVRTFGDIAVPATTLIHSPQAAVTITLSILFLPVFDALRVFALRASRKTSPLRADRTHLHYYLLDAGFSHTMSTSVIVGANVLLIIVTCLLQDASVYLQLANMVLLSSALLYFVFRLRQKNLGQLHKQIPA